MLNRTDREQNEAAKWRGLLSGGLPVSLRSLWGLWKKFWFEPQSPVPLCLFRIIFGLLVLEWCWLAAPNLLACYGNKGVLLPETAARIAPAPMLNLIAFFHADDSLVVAMFVVLVIASLCLTLGLFSRVSSILVYLLLVSFDHRNIYVNHSGVKLMCLASFYLMFAPTGAALSLDKLSRIWLSNILPAREAQPCVLWALRAYQLQWVLLYCQTFWTKFMSPSWGDGTNMYYVLRDREFWRFPVPLIADNLELCKLAGWFTMLAEFMAWTLIYFRETRYIVLSLLLLLHVGIEYSMNIPMFEHMMIASLIVFVYPEDLSKLKNRVSQWAAKIFGPPVVLTFNGSLTNHARLARTVECLDILGRVKTIDISSQDVRESLPQAMPEECNRRVLLFCGEQWLSSFDRFRPLFARLPLCWPLYPLMALRSRISSTSETG